MLTHYPHDASATKLRQNAELLERFMGSVMRAEVAAGVPLAPLMTAYDDGKRMLQKLDAWNPDGNDAPPVGVVERLLRCTHPEKWLPY